MSIDLHALDSYLKTKCNFDIFTDIDTVNGIQVSRKKQDIHTIACAVDSSFPVIQHAAHAFANSDANINTSSADVLMVHHGMFWGTFDSVTGPVHNKLSSLLCNDMALYAMHLPLDAHMQFGNNAQIASMLGLKEIAPFGEYKGRKVGVQGIFSQAMHRESVIATLFPPAYTWKDAPYLSHYTLPIQEVGTSYYNAILSSSMSPLGKAFHGREEISSVAIISGGMPRNALYEAKQQNIDMLICGDASHILWLEAQEYGINILSAGHYYTETWGIMALLQHLCEQFSLKGVFIHAPTQH